MVLVSQTVTSKIPSRQIDLWTVPLNGEHRKFIFEPGGRGGRERLDAFPFLRFKCHPTTPGGGVGWCGLTGQI